MLKLGITEVGESNCTSRMILAEVPCKDPELCVNYQKLNKIIKMEYYLLSNIEQIFAANYVTIFVLANSPQQKGSAVCSFLYNM